MRSRWLKLLGVLFTLSLVAAACGDSDDDDGGTATTEGGTETTAEGGATTEGGTETTAEGGAATTAGGEGGEAADLSGLEFTLFGAPTGVEGDAMQGFLDVYGEQTGADITYEGSDSFEEQLRIRVDGGNPPSVAFTPQPASICEFADAGELVSLEDMGYDTAAMETVHGSFWMNLGVCEDGNHYGVPWFPNLKSIVWYNVAAFEEGGYEIPATYEELVALSQQIVDDGGTPWCIGYGSEADTGWPGTDWIEDIIVRSSGADTYTQWFQHEIPFDDPAVVGAFDMYEEIFFGDGFVLGGTDNVAAIDFRDAPLPMFDDPPGCLMHKQGSFIANFFPEGGEEEVSFFPFPTIGGNTGAMGGGDTLIVFEDDPAIAQAVQDWTTPTWQCVLASPSGGTASEFGGHGVAGVERLPGNKDTSLDCYETETARIQAGAIRDALEADAFVFDASDLMPSAVGQGTFWTGMIDWSRGTPTAEVVSAVESSWPA